MTNLSHHFTRRSLWRVWLSVLALLLILAGCDTGRPQQTVSTDDGKVMMREAIDNLRLLSSFRVDVTQGGTPYEFFFQLGPTGFEFVTTMSRAEGAYIAPDALYANARIDLRGVFVNVGIFANSVGQWLRPLTGSWIAYEYAPGFDPRDMMQDGTGFQYAIENLTEVRVLGYETRGGTDVLHLRGNATGDVVNSLLFGLLYILEDNAVVDVFIDLQRNLPSELLLTLPETETAESDDTFWQIEIYDMNEAVTIPSPQGVLEAVPEPLPSVDAAAAVPINVPWFAVLAWTSGLSALLGAIVTPLIFQRNQRSIGNGLVLGAGAGALGSLILLIPLWLSVKPESDDAPQKRGDSVNLGDVNPWVVMGFIAIPVFVGSLDLTVVSAFLPELVTELGLPFDTGLDDASWVVTAYLLAYTISLTFMGRLSDLWGRRAIYVASLIVFIIGSIWVAIAHAWPTDALLAVYRSLGQRPDPAIVNLQVVIAGRVVEAIGAGALVPVSLALVGDIFPPDRRARPLGLVAAMDTLGWVLGPVYGGIFMQIMTWQGLFWMNVPLTLLSLVSVLYALRHVPVLRSPGRFDLLGTVLIVGSLSAMTIGLGANVDLSGSSASLDNLSPLPDNALPLLGLAVGLFIAFVWVESRVRDPLLNLDMFRRKNLAAAALANLLIGYCLFIGLTSVPLLINLRQVDTLTSASLSAAALQVGAMLSTLTLPMAFAALPGGWLSDRIGIKHTVILGLVLSLVGFVLVWQTWTLSISNLWIGLQMALVGTGIGLTFSPISTAIINSAREEERGVAGAIVLILRLIGMTLSISTLSSIMFYRLNALAAAATEGMQTLDTQAINDAYLASAIQILGEMGLIGAVLSGLAIIPALWLDRQVRLS